MRAVCETGQPKLSKYKVGESFEIAVSKRTKKLKTSQVLNRKQV